MIPALHPIEDEEMPRLIHREIMIECPGCHMILPNRRLDPPDRTNASGECLQLYSDLMCYTVAKQDPEFIHQHVVDSDAAQHDGGSIRNITVAFGLIGLYLALEKGYTGKQVQRAHMRIVKVRNVWPRVELPLQPAVLTVMDVFEAGTDGKKDTMIRKWMAAVWESWSESHAWIRMTTDKLLASSGKWGSGKTR